jgi:2-polyprenyl-3-methyl-5-hydroxy-6-metoxy-1,4-benzoquinol methylase
VDTHKEENYYGLTRIEIEPLLNRTYEHALEVGCGAGATLKWLKESAKVQRTSGIEPNSEAATLARTHLDTLYEGTLDEHLEKIPDASIDLLLCLDVLEHLVDPWLALSQLQKKLKHSGLCIISLPNAQHYSVSFGLLRGKWEYTDAGLLDSTHLRFFTRNSAESLVHDAGLKIEKRLSTYAWGTHDRLIDQVTLKAFNGLLTFQYLIACSQPSSTSA